LNTKHEQVYFNRIGFFQDNISPPLEPGQSRQNIILKKRKFILMFGLNILNQNSFDNARPKIFGGFTIQRS